MEKIRLFIISLFAFCMFMPDAMIAQERYQVGVCDWMVLKRQKLGEFELAKQLGCDGIEMDMGSLGTREMFDNKIRDPKEAAIFKRTADSLGIKVGAVAMSGFYAQDLSKKDTYMALAEDCFDTMDKMGQTTVAFLPLGGSGNDWSTDKAKRTIIVKRLHDIGEMAKARGKKVGIDTPLDAKGNLKLLKEMENLRIIGASKVRFNSEVADLVGEQLPKPDDEDPVAEQLDIQKEIWDIIIRRVFSGGKFSKQSQAVFRLAVAGELSAAEIGERYDMKANAVYQVKARVLEAAKKELARMKRGGDDLFGLLDKLLAEEIDNGQKA